MLQHEAVAGGCTQQQCFVESVLHVFVRFSDGAARDHCSMGAGGRGLDNVKNCVKFFF